MKIQMVIRNESDHGYIIVERLPNKCFKLGKNRCN